MTKKTNIISQGVFFVLLFLLSITLSFGRGYGYAVTEGINLWVACVIPSLFPYLVITAMFSSMSFTMKVGKLFSPFTRRIFNCGGITGYAFFISLISGYPVGAKTVSDLKTGGFLGDAESVRASCVCSTSSPTFLLNSVGVFMFNQPIFGVKLFATHILSSIIVGYIFSFYKRKEKTTSFYKYNPHNSGNVLYDSVSSAVTSLLVVGGLITFFYLLTEVLFSIGVLTPFIYLLTRITGNEKLSRSIVFGFFECTCGLKALSVTSCFFTFPIACAICGFGGLSVLFQSLSFLKKGKIKTAPFILSKVTSAVINFCLGCIFSLIFP